MRTHGIVRYNRIHCFGKEAAGRPSRRRSAGIRRPCQEAAACFAPRRPSPAMRRLDKV